MVTPVQSFTRPMAPFAGGYRRLSLRCNEYEMNSLVNINPAFCLLIYLVSSVNPSLLGIVSGFWPWLWEYVASKPRVVRSHGEWKSR